MKIINLNTQNIFELPEKDAMELLESSPNLFAKVTKNKRIIKNKKVTNSQNTVLNTILDE